MTGTTFTATPRTITWGANGGGFDIADAANTFTVAQPLIGGGGLTKAGTGTLILTGSNSCSGPATASGGKLVLFNATAFNSPATIASGATLAWSGNGGYVNGSTAATIALNSGGTLENLNPANYMVINGAVTISNTVNATAAGDRGFLSRGWIARDRDRHDQRADCLEGSAVDLGGGVFASVNYHGGAGNDVVVMFVPEPSTVSLLAMAAADLLGRRKRSRAFPENHPRAEGAETTCIK